MAIVGHPTVNLPRQDHGLSRGDSKKGASNVKRIFLVFQTKTSVLFVETSNTDGALGLCFAHSGVGEHPRPLRHYDYHLWRCRQIHHRRGHGEHLPDLGVEQPAGNRGVWIGPVCRDRWCRKIGEYTTSGATVNASLISGLNNPQGIAVSGSDLFVAIDSPTRSANTPPRGPRSTPR